LQLNTWRIDPRQVARMRQKSGAVSVLVNLRRSSFCASHVAQSSQKLTGAADLALGEWPIGVTHPDGSPQCPVYFGTEAGLVSLDLRHQRTSIWPRGKETEPHSRPSQRLASGRYPLRNRDSAFGTTCGDAFQTASFSIRSAVLPSSPAYRRLRLGASWSITGRNAGDSLMFRAYTLPPTLKRNPVDRA